MALSALYQQIIMEHGKNPRNFGKLAGRTISVRHDNPNCGDRIDLYIAISPALGIQDLKFDGYGCAVALASASIMTTVVKGLAREECLALLAEFQNLVTSGKAISTVKEFADLLAFAGLHAHPMRQQCALLPWQALAKSFES